MKSCLAPAWSTIRAKSSMPITNFVAYWATIRHRWRNFRLNNCYQSSRETPRIGLRRAFMAQEGTIRSEWAREVCLIQVLKRDSSVIGVEIGLVPLKVGGSLLTQSQIDWALLYLISFGFLLACYLRRWDGRLAPVWLSASRRGLLIKWCCYQPKMYPSNVGREKNCNKRGKKPSRPTGPVCLLHEPRNSPSCTVYCFS